MAYEIKRKNNAPAPVKTQAVTTDDEFNEDYLPEPDNTDDEYEFRDYDESPTNRQGKKPAPATPAPVKTQAVTTDDEFNEDYLPEPDNTDDEYEFRDYDESPTNRQGKKPAPATPAPVKTQAVTTDDEFNEDYLPEPDNTDDEYEFRDYDDSPTNGQGKKPAPATPAQQATQTQEQAASEQAATPAQQAVKQPELLNENGTLNTADATDTYARYREKLAQLGSARRAIAEMMRPEEEERKRRERSLRRVALGQAIGDIVGGLFGFGIAQKNGSPVVVPESQATKTLARLQKLQEEGLVDRENYRKLLGNLRLKTLEDELAAEKGIADKEAANAQQLALLETRLKAQADREDKKDKQWQTTQNERERHNRAMETIGAKRVNGRGGNNDEDGYAAYLRPSERLVTKTTDDGSLVGGKKTTTYRQRMPGMTKEERKRWNAIAAGIVHDLGYDDASDAEISGLLAPLQRLLSGSINEATIRDLIHEYNNKAYDILANIARDGISIDEEDIAEIRKELADGEDPSDIIDNIRAIVEANKNKANNK